LRNNTTSPSLIISDEQRISLEMNGPEVLGRIAGPSCLAYCERDKIRSG
jgi:hypothetical protein